MSKSLSRNFELQTWITFIPIGQMKWGFLLHFTLDLLYHNHSLHFIKSHHSKIAFFTWLEFEFGGKKVNLKTKHFPCIPTLAFGSK
jgi:hypothetical protein